MIYLESPERLQIPDGKGGVHFGCDQMWYASFWRRQAGCGPCVASNLLLYLQASGRLRLPMVIQDQSGLVALMDSTWRHVTPNLKGVSTLAHFCGGVHTYLRELESALDCRTLEIPARRSHRPAISKVATFIADGLSSGCPVAFLNRSNGSVENLDAWHWVTIVSIEQEPDTGRYVVGVYDAAHAIVVDLSCWYETTTGGGGFVFIG